MEQVRQDSPSMWQGQIWEALPTISQIKTQVEKWAASEKTFWVTRPIRTVKKLSVEVESCSDWWRQDNPGTWSCEITPSCFPSLSHPTPCLLAHVFRDPVAWICLMNWIETTLLCIGNRCCQIWAGGRKGPHEFIHKVGQLESREEGEREAGVVIYGSRQYFTCHYARDQNWPSYYTSDYKALNGVLNFSLYSRCMARKLSLPFLSHFVCVFQRFLQ